MDEPSSSASSPAQSPRLSVSVSVARPQHNCIECKRLKRRCDKGLPCGQCAKAGRNCEYRDPADDGLFGPISQAKDINSMAFGTLLDILVNRPRVKEAVSLYFSGIHTWFTVIDRASLERELETAWSSLQAATSVMVLCMALLARPPTQKPGKGMSDTVYHTVKGTLSAVQSHVPLSIPLLQSELLLAMYEFSQGKPQQAYMSVGRCLHITKALQWHEPGFWCVENQMNKPRELKLCSILWWAIVYVDCLVNIGYQDQPYPMHTMGVSLLAEVPLPGAFDLYLPSDAPPQFGAQEYATNDHVGTIVFPEATSACYLSAVLQHLSNPALSRHDPKALTEQIWQHAKGTRAEGSAFIALMKLNSPGLLGGMDVMSMADPGHAHAIRIIQIMTNVIPRKAAKLAEAEAQLNRGAIDPCWAFAMCYASQLLILDREGVLQGASWQQKVASMQAALDRVSKRWKIAERYCTAVQTNLDNRYSAPGPLPTGGLGPRPATSAGSPRALFVHATTPPAPGPGAPGNSAYGRRTSY